MLPRDFYQAQTIGLIKLARVYSNVVSPPVMFGVLGLAICLYALPVASAVVWFLVYSFWVSLFPILFVLYLLHIGWIKELHMSDTRERHLPYLVAVLSAGLTWGITHWFEGPELLRCLVLFNIVELIMLGLVNTVWLISLHSTGASAVTAVVYYVWGLNAALFIGLPLVVSVSVVRLYLRRHTPSQILAGIALGGVAMSLMRWVGCFA